MKSGPIIEATFDGFKDAFDIYWRWTGGYDLTGVEHVATFCIAKEIHALDSVSFVQLEQNARDARSHARGSLRGIGQKTLPFRARVDIAVWNSIPQVKGVIEIKTSNVSFSNLQKDIDKICAVLKDDKSTTHWGLVAYYQSLDDRPNRSAEERLKARIHKNFSRVSEYVVNKGCKCEPPDKRPKIEVYEDWAWCMDILKISRTN